MIETYVDLAPTINKFKKLGGKLSQPQQFLDDVGQYFLDKAENSFRKEVDPYGKKWQPLSSATIDQKQRLGYPLKILTRTGTMRSSVRYQVKKKSVQIVFDSSYATFHQTGTRKMPKRQILPETKLAKTDERNIVDLGIEYLGI